MKNTLNLYDEARIKVAHLRNTHIHAARYKPIHTHICPDDGPYKGSILHPSTMSAVPRTHNNNQGIVLSRVAFILRGEIEGCARKEWNYMYTIRSWVDSESLW